jgi:hypothetical protein
MDVQPSWGSSRWDGDEEMKAFLARLRRTTDALEAALREAARSVSPDNVSPLRRQRHDDGGRPICPRCDQAIFAGLPVLRRNDQITHVRCHRSTAAAARRLPRSA